MSELSAAAVIELLHLSPLPGEGGFFRETYRSTDLIPAATFAGRYQGEHKHASTCIFYLLTADSYSALHRLKTDEIYHFYRGDAVSLTLLDQGGKLQQVTLGSRFEEGQICQFMVPAGVWQGSRLTGGGQWALLGTTVAPAFDFADCTLADAQLLGEYPQHRSVLEPLLARQS